MFRTENRRVHVFSYDFSRSIKQQRGLIKKILSWRENRVFYETTGTRL